MKKIYIWLVLIAPAFFFESCIKPQSEAFPAPPDLSTTNTKYEDNFDVELETYRFDTINCTSRLKLFAGKSIDPELGTIEAQSFFQFLPVSYTDSFPKIFKKILSATLTLRYDSRYGQFGNDQFGLHKLTEELDGDKSYFSTSGITPYSPDPYLTTSGAIRDKRFIRIDIKENLAKEIFLKWEELKIFKNDRQFLDLWKGFALRSLDSIPQLTRFDLADTTGYTAMIQINYRHQSGSTVADTVDDTYELKASQASVHYFKISPGIDASNKFVELFPSQIPKKHLSSNLTNNKSAIQGLTALATKMKIPGLSAWKAQQTEKIKIFKAELEITPDNPGSLDVPGALSMTHNTDYYDAKETINNVIFNDENIFKLLQFTSTSTIDAAKNQLVSREFGYSSTSKSYKCNITSHVQAIIDGTINSTDLNVYSTDWNNTVNRMLITKGNVKLKLYYLPLSTQ